MNIKWKSFIFHLVPLIVCLSLLGLGVNELVVTVVTIALALAAWSSWLIKED